MPTRKPCRAEGCLLPKDAPRHFCAFHGLQREPIERQVSASKLRLASVPEDRRLARVPAEMWPTGWRFCAGCQSMVPKFYTSGTRCSACASAATHGAMIERTYDLTAAQYAALLELQDGKCAICRTKPRSQRLAVEHDHQTGRVRGLCCVKCNHELLGAAHDSLALLNAAVAYLEHPPSSGDWSAPSKEIRETGPVSTMTATVLGSIPYYLSAEDGYEFVGSRGEEIIYVQRGRIDPPF